VTGGQRLIVMRHAKAEPYAANDHVRRLTDRGAASARDVGRHLGEQGLTPQYVAVSSSTRTRQTWAAVAEGLDVSDTEVSFDDALFTGSADVVVSTLQAVPADAETVMFVGHNPTAEYLCHFLDDGDGDPAAVSNLLKGFPPAAVAVLDIGVAWADLAAETGRVVGYYVGQG
jgi:phosphohistidine phosphatase